jgi:hypothetical protein
MTNRKLGLRSHEIRRWVPSIAFAASVAALFVVGAPPAQAKQMCSVASGGQGYWSWRIIDGRKCWYQGKPMLSKAALEWPAHAAVRAESHEGDELASATEEKRGNPLDAQAYEPADSTTFEAMWRDRVEKRLP